MNVPFLIARRYLFSKKITHAINLITSISVIGIAIGTAALLLILSVFNGFEDLMKSYLDKFNPDLKIIPKEGKFFAVDSVDISQILQLEEIVGYSIVLEEVALLEYGEKQQVGIIKGVDKHYLEVTTLNNAIKEGEILLSSEGPYDYATVGNGVYNNLNISLQNKFTPLKVYVPNRKKRGVFDKDFKSWPLYISAVFAIQNERDNQYVICPYNIASDLLDSKGMGTAIELKMRPSSDQGYVISQLEQILGSGFIVQDRYRQDESFLKIMNIEKWSSFLIFGFTLILIIFNVVGSLWMIVLDKKKDISILQSFGATKKVIRSIFLIEGGLISLLGFAIGFVFAIIFYLLQKNVGIIRVPDGFSISSYPIELRLTDILVVFLTVMILGFLASLPATFRAAKVSSYVRIE